MPSSTIVSLALLKVNWDLFKKDYLENFVPLIAECVRLSENDLISAPNLQKELRIQFGLQFPQAAIITLIKRLRKRGYLKLENAVFVRNNAELAKLNFHSAQQQVLVMHETLVDHLRKFCEEVFSVKWSLIEAESALQDYLRSNEIFVMNSVTENTVIPKINHPVSNSRYRISAFIKQVQQEQSSDLEYLSKISEGNMLANAIFLSDPFNANKKFKNTSIYFDTSFLVFALGYAGAPRKDPCTELLQLLYETGAELFCFTHTVDEIRGILDACGHMIGQGDKNNGYGPSIEYFISNHLSESDIELLANRIEKDLETIRIKVIDKPPFIEKYGIDEIKLGEVLSENIPYRREQPMHKDIDSLSAIMRLRQGKQFFTIENCKALFVTTNFTLAKVAREFFKSESSEGTIAPCIPDHTLTNLIWLKKPLDAPDLPRKRIIADCYAALQPSEKLIRLYMEEITKLEGSKQLSADDVFLLRYSLEAKRALMDLTSGEERSFTQGTLSEILEIVKHRITSGYVEQIDSQKRIIEKTEESERQAKELATKVIEESQAKDMERDNKLKLRSQKYARVVLNIFKYGILLVLLVSTFYTFPWSLPQPKQTMGRYGLVAGFVILIIISILNFKSGLTLDTLFRTFEIKLSKYFERKLKQLVE